MTAPSADMIVKTALVWLAIAASLPQETLCWDVAVTAGEQIDFFHNNGSIIESSRRRFNRPSALTYDSVHETLYFSDKINEDISIFSYKLDSLEDVQKLTERKFGNIKGIAYDPIIETLFWIDGKMNCINSMLLNPSLNPNHVSYVLLNFTNGEEPKGITIDICRRYIYWTDLRTKNATIERITIDGKNRTAIIKDDLYTPLGITIDQATQKLCWTDDKPGNFYKIECSNLDGSNRTLVYHGKFHQPYNLVVNNGMVYWTEWSFKSILKIALESNNQTEPISFNEYKLRFPIGIVAKINLLEQIKGVPECKGLENFILNVTNEHLMPQDEGVPSNTPVYCLNNGKPNFDNKLNFNLCKCSRGFTGERCEISMCHNYCINGTCTMDNEGFPKCRCDNGFNGERCNISICEGYCLNNGSCEVNDNEQAVCTCLSGWKGSRCGEINRTTSDYKHQENNLNSITMEEKMTNTVKHENLSPEAKNKNLNKSFVALTSSAEPIESNIFEENNDCFTWNAPIAPIPVITFLTCVCFLLSIIIVILVRKVIVLKKRPRIKKRIIVNKNVTPLTYRPNPPQCEITIENCCNMNVCETPCFEPNNLQAQITDMKAKDEKKQLLLNQDLYDGNY